MKKHLKYLWTVIPLMVIAFLGLKYIKNPDVFLRKKDVDKAKERIKAARNTAATSTELRRKAAYELSKVEAKAKVRYSELELSLNDVGELEVVHKSIKQARADRKIKAPTLIKRRKHD